MIDRSEALEVWESADWAWTWYVMEKNPHSWFCLVTSPFIPEGELGDVYVTDITSNATLVE